MSITILNPGMLTSVQDLGRIGYQQFGVSVSGVMDPRSASIANILVGNDEGEAALMRPTSSQSPAATLARRLTVSVSIPTAPFPSMRARRCASPCCAPAAARL